MIRNVILWSLVIGLSLVLLGSLNAFGQQWNPPRLSSAARRRGERTTSVGPPTI